VADTSYVGVEGSWDANPILNILYQRWKMCEKSSSGSMKALKVQNN